MSEKMTMKTLSEMLSPAETVSIEIKEGPLAGVCLNIRKSIPMNEATKLASNVAGSCIDLESAEYTPEAYDIALKINTVSIYAGINLGRYDIAKVYRLMYETDIYRIVCDVINMDQYGAIIEAINNRIGFMKDMMTSTAAQKTMEMLSQLNEFAGAAQTMTEQMKSMNFEQTLDSAMSAILRADRPEDSHQVGANTATEEPSKVLVMKKKKD